jgi:hypothetical protein
MTINNCLKVIGLLAVLNLVACKRPSSAISSSNSMTSSVLQDVKSKTGVELPKTSKLLNSKNDNSRLNADLWLIKVDSTNQLKFPAELRLLNSSDCRDSAGEMERISGVSLGVPVAGGFASWQFLKSQCHVTVLMTTNVQYLMLERLY